MGKADDSQYGVVLDAGSSGTRVYIYRWPKSSRSRESANAQELKSLPIIETKDKWTKKVHPGVSTFGDKPELVGSDHLQQLLDHALQHIPQQAVKDTPVFLLATAGVRLLPSYQRKTLLSKICSYIQSETNFLLPDCNLHVQTIPGETEGLYGWIAANYLLGGFDAPKEHDHGKGHHTYGFLDMGGASAQIAFAPNNTEADRHANDLKLVRFRNVDGSSQEYKVFVTTWLGYGANEARRRYVEALTDSFGSSGPEEMPDPCLPKGLLMTTAGKIMPDDAASKPSEPHLVGTGLFSECLRRTFPLLGKDVQCVDEPCLLNGIHVPAIDFDVNHFIGVSEYWHTTHEIFEMAHKDKAYDFNTYQRRVQEFCQQDWSTIESGLKEKTWGKKVDAQTAYEVCFKASWLINMLHDGIGIPRVGLEKTPVTHNGTKEVLEAGKQKGYLSPFQAVDKIGSSEVSWTLGKMVLYASASVPAITSDTAPVGFGSNEPGVLVPADFEYPGGGRLQPIPEGTSSESGSLTGKFPPSIFKSDPPHRIPGFIFFLLIMIIAIFYLCGRDRRSRLYHSYFHPSQYRSGRSPGSTSLRPLALLERILSRRSTSLDYTHDLEGNGATARLYDPAQFELGDMTASSSSDDEHGATTHGAGYTSPSKKPFRKSRSKKTSSSRSSLVAVAAAGPGSGGRLSPESAIDRTGLVVRTESRDNLAGEMFGGRKSRSGSLSPTRFREPMRVS